MGRRAVIMVGAHARSHGSPAVDSSGLRLGHGGDREGVDPREVRWVTGVKGQIPGDGSRRDQRVIGPRCRLPTRTAK